MKRDSFYSGLTAFVLAMLVALSGIACIISAFSFDVSNWGPFCIWCGWFTLAATIFLSFRRGGLVFLALILLTLNHLLRNTTLLNSLTRVIYHITELYDRGYHWGHPQWGTPEVLKTAPDGGLLVISCLSSLVVVWALLRKKPVIYAMLSGIIPLLSCCILLDTPPDLLPLWLLMIGLSMLILTRSTSRLNPQRALRLTATLLIPVILFCSVIFLWGPKFPYENTAKDLLNQVTDLLTPDPNDDPGTGTGGSGNSGGDLGGVNTGNNGSTVGLYADEFLDLTQVGSLYQNKTKVMTVSTQHRGTVYLRAQAYDVYTGTGWKVLSDTDGDKGWPFNVGSSNSAFNMTITTLQAKDIKFIPYYINEYNWHNNIQDGVLPNPDSLLEYSYQVIATIPTNSNYWTLSDEEWDQYVDLPDDTLAAATDILAQLGIVAGDHTIGETEIVERIQNYVLNSATYNLKTGKMPRKESDFVMWFLEDSDTGYCVHFASATTVLLRAAGIPARFVNGYMIGISSDSTLVTENQAHAWVEYLSTSQGWTVLEATPARADPDPTDPTEPTSPTPTVPPETEPTEPTEPPTEPPTAPPTEPPATTPTESTDPTEPIAPPREPMDWTGVIIAGQILLVVAAIWGQYRFRLWLRTFRFTRGTPNRQAVKRWRYARRFGRLAHNKPPIELHQLTEKAVFSQHCLTEAELSMYDQWITDAQQQFLLKFKPIRLILKLILAI